MSRSKKDGRRHGAHFRSRELTGKRRGPKSGFGGWPVVTGRHKGYTKKKSSRQDRRHAKTIINRGKLDS